MPSLRLCPLLLVSASLGLAAPGTASFREQQWKFPRVRTAAREKDEVVKHLLLSKGLSYPPKAILLRAFKKEGAVELVSTSLTGSIRKAISI